MLTRHWIVCQDPELHFFAECIGSARMRAKLARRRGRFSSFSTWDPFWGWFEGKLLDVNMEGLRF